jgi:hypothetical protein
MAILAEFAKLDFVFCDAIGAVFPFSALVVSLLFVLEILLTPTKSLVKIGLRLIVYGVFSCILVPQQYYEWTLALAGHGGAAEVAQTFWFSCVSKI